MANYAYIRVSTKDQSIARQILAVQPYDIPKQNIYTDLQSGKDFERPAYKQLITQLQAGDLLIIKSIDRLGRNYNDILVQWQYITKKVKADILVLDMALLDTRRDTGNLTGMLIADLVLQIFAYVAQTEREFIHQRQAEGIAAAKSAGKKLGRNVIRDPQNLSELCNACVHGSITTRKAAELAGLSHTTFYRRYRKFLNENKPNFVSNGRLFGTNATA